MLHGIYWDTTKIPSRRMQAMEWFTNQHRPLGDTIVNIVHIDIQAVPTSVFRKAPSTDKIPDKIYGTLFDTKI